MTGNFLKRNSAIVMLLCRLLRMSCCLGVMLLWAFSLCLADAPVLVSEDCQKCHARETTLVTESGGQHRDALVCVDCHKEHPPRGGKSIPACAMCHEPTEKPHFAVAGCLACHQPHSPLDINFQNATRVAPACQSCHPDQMAEMLAYISYHTVLDCDACHPKHGTFLDCLDCHQPHLADQTYAVCRRCHNPHSPLKVVYDNDIGSEHCASCHRQAGEQLQQTTTKHRLLLCVYCHKNQHKRVPACVVCHYEPHMPGFHEKFPECVSCHIGPHNLVN